MNEANEQAPLDWAAGLPPALLDDTSAAMLRAGMATGPANVAAQVKRTAELAAAEAERVRMSTQPKPRTPEEQADWDARMAYRDQMIRNLEAAPRLARQSWRDLDDDSVTSVGTPQSAAPLDASDLTRGMFKPS